MNINIITPSFNQRSFLAETARSILSQAGDFQLNWIVIDGGSTDGTLDLLQSIADPHLKWISQSDAGQSDAINQGLSRAAGDIIGWLNSDDLYAPGALDAVAQAFTAHPQTQWLAGRYQIIDQSGAVFRSPIARYKDRSLDRYSYRKLLRENFIAQPAVFWRRDFGQRIGPLDRSLHYTMDYDLWLRMGRAADPLILNRVLAQFRLHPQSKSGQVTRKQFDEGYQVACRYFDGDTVSRLMHRLNVEKIVWAYRLMRWLGR